MHPLRHNLIRSIVSLSVLAGCGDSSSESRGGGFDSHAHETTWAGNPTTSSAGDTLMTTTSGDLDEGGSGSGGTTQTAPPVCGNGVVEDGEACDDGQGNGQGQACKSDCTPALCGDGVLDPGEDCDEGQANGPDGACSAACAVNPSACGTVEVAATIEKEPLDVIFVIDNSYSMHSEIGGIQDNINENFAAILDAAGLDTTTVVLSKYSGTANYPIEGVCIEAPLGQIPKSGCENPPAKPGSTETFSHYSTIVSSTNAWCKILETGVGVTDEFGSYGWMKWLRKEAFKAFILVSDDAADCSFDSLKLYDNQFDANNLMIAQKFDEALRTKNPSKFGALDAERRYTVHSLVGLAGAPDGEPYGPTEPTVLATCPTAGEPGAGHQALSKLTGGLRFPVCDTDNYEKVFKALAESMIKGAKITCEFPMPAAPEGKALDPASISVNYYPMGQQGAPQSFTLVSGPLNCAPGRFYLDGETIHLCQETCADVQQDSDAEIKVEFKCLPVTPG